MPNQLLKIRHYGLPFLDNENARQVLRTATHVYVRPIDPDLARLIAAWDGGR
ncbi:hypothetical protein [Asticcacaulis benevestitus]|uniref:hypothetical protein n=1 Tax=Asticcacaulis benevestitus TaxID=347481 RepID=UPI0003A8BA3A|nr:hypothetical protein [Asticcacaulis benevestitus]